MEREYLKQQIISRTRTSQMYLSISREIHLLWAGNVLQQDRFTNNNVSFADRVFLLKSVECFAFIYDNLTRCSKLIYFVLYPSNFESLVHTGCLKNNEQICFSYNRQPLVNNYVHWSITDGKMKFWLLFSDVEHFRRGPYE